ncbi:MAG: Rossmann-like domain-containing protein [Promethearchaeota archaeon]
MILEKTVKDIKQIYKIHKIPLPKVTNIVIGLGYTGVEVSVHAFKPFLGLAATLPNIIKTTDCNKIKFAGNLTKKNLSELLNWSYEPLSLKKIIGIASVNAVSQHIFKMKNPYPTIIGDQYEYLNVSQDTKITIIGLMKPLIRKLSEITDKITIIEDTISVPPEFNKFLIKKNINQLKKIEFFPDILYCTGTALINNTLELILEKFKSKAQSIVLIGPTASMIPDILFDYGVDIVGGMEIFDSKATLKVLQEGGGTKIFKQYGKKYNLIKN